MVVVVAVIVTNVIIMGRRRMGLAMRIVVMVDGVAARAARMRADQRDDPRENGSQQRQKYDCLYHRRISPSSD
ncbi:hypothetical protein ACVWY2_001584 [Bradyrhizobium sp. JR6.1]